MTQNQATSPEKTSHPCNYLSLFPTPCWVTQGKNHIPESHLSILTETFCLHPSPVDQTTPWNPPAHHQEPVADKYLCHAKTILIQSSFMC